MVNQNSVASTCHFLPSLGDLELLEVILAPENTTYPWDPADDTAEDYFHQLEQESEWQSSWTVEESTQKATDFCRHLDMIWSQFPNYHPEILDKQMLNRLHDLLDQTFAKFVPSVWLTTIAQQATAIFTLEQSPSEKLVACVQALLPTWCIDDLLVLARPYAISMRGKSQQLISITDNLEQQDWASLSEIDQAKISLLIANFALKQLDNFQSEPSQNQTESLP